MDFFVRLDGDINPININIILKKGRRHWGRPAGMGLCDLLYLRWNTLNEEVPTRFGRKAKNRKNNSLK